MFQSGPGECKEFSFSYKVTSLACVCIALYCIGIPQSRTKKVGTASKLSPPPPLTMLIIGWFFQHWLGGMWSGSSVPTTFGRDCSFPELNFAENRFFSQFLIVFARNGTKVRCLKENKKMSKKCVFSKIQFLKWRHNHSQSPVFAPHRKWNSTFLVHQKSLSIFLFYSYQYIVEILSSK